MNISQTTDWYKVKREDIYKHGGQILLQRYYNNSLYEVQMRSTRMIFVGFGACISGHSDISMDISGACTTRHVGKHRQSAVLFQDGAFLIFKASFLTGYT